MGDRKSVRNIQDDGCLAILVQTGLLHYSYDFWKIIALKQKYHIQRKKKNVQEIHSTLLQPVLVRVQCWHNTYTICLLICLSNLRGNDHYYKCWKSGPSSSPKMNKNALYLTIHKWTFAHRLQNNKLKLKLAKLNWIKSY